MKRINLSNKTIGEWLVLRYAGNSKWLCECTCKNCNTLKKPVRRCVEGRSLRRTPQVSTSCGWARDHRMKAGELATQLVGTQFGQDNCFVITDSGVLRRERKIFTVVICKCVHCGRSRSYRPWQVERGRTTAQCFCQRGYKNKQQAQINAVVKYIKRHAKNREIAFYLSDQETRAFFQQRCHYCGREPSNKYAAPRTVKTGLSFTYNGIDRKDSKQAYTTANCVACCGTCNMMKKKMSEEAFLSHVQRIWEHSCR